MLHRRDDLNSTALRCGLFRAEYKFKDWEAKDVMEKTWKDTPENMQIKMTGNIGVIFENLKNQGFQLITKNFILKR